MAVADYGIICAPPGAGKTVMGCALIARHRTATLVLVHRTVLLDQWRQEAAKFLGITKRKEIGIWRGATRRLTHKLDIAMLPSLAHLEDYAALLLLLQCGPIRQTLRTPTEEAVPRTVYVRRSSFHVPDKLGQRPPIHAVWAALVADDGRAEQIVGDICACLADGRCPLVLSDRKVHLDKLAAALLARSGDPAPAIYRLESGIGKKERESRPVDPLHPYGASRTGGNSTGSWRSERHRVSHPLIDILEAGEPMDVASYVGREALQPRPGPAV